MFCIRQLKALSGHRWVVINSTKTFLKKIEETIRMCHLGNWKCDSMKIFSQMGFHILLALFKKMEVAS